MRRDSDPGGMGGPFGGGAGRQWPPVPRLWPGETVTICASGPSLTEEDVNYVRGKCRVIVINSTYKMAPWADLLYACDWGWWNKYQPEFAGMKVSQDVNVLKLGGVLRVPSCDDPGISFDPLRINQGTNSGFQALNLAVLLGAKRVILLGYDMQLTDGKTHWHGDHPSGLNNPVHGQFPSWCRVYEEAAPQLAGAGIEVINATRQTALGAFPRVALESVL